jgi:hypothetical protein
MRTRSRVLEERDAIMDGPGEQFCTDPNLTHAIGLLIFLESEREIMFTAEQYRAKAIEYFKLPDDSERP